MKTLTIKQEMIDRLDTDESKLRFANDVISMFSEHEPATNNLTAKALYNGLNTNLPALQIGASFDSKNMGVTEVRRYHFAQAGYVPVSLNCGYNDYEYRRLDDMSESDIRSFIEMVNREISHSKSKRGHLKFLHYLRLACGIYCIEADRENCLVSVF